MKNRTYLKDSILLCSESDSGRFMRRFNIIRRMEGSGSSAVCYEASHSGNARGVLKEFYPLDTDDAIYALERNAERQLAPARGLFDAREKFDRALANYIEPYRLLGSIRSSAAETDELSTFIPSFEIYYGCDKAMNITGTVYIWTPETPLITFDRFLDGIHRQPEEKPEYNLVQILRSLESLTRCTGILHGKDLVHRDIKPSNFGFCQQNGEMLTQTISLFDVNSICSIYNQPEETIGTPGFMEPEAAYSSADNQTDIYAIGATLFNAVVITDETRKGNYLYKDKYYDRLDDMVNSSQLICASEANSHPRLRNLLTQILKGCLAPRALRIKGCEEVHKLIRDALFYALPSSIASRNTHGERWILANVENQLDGALKKNSVLAFQHHLYNHPLYQAEGDPHTLNVLIVGFGNYGQKFLDVCLQAGQMWDRELNVTVLSRPAEKGDLSDKDLYLKERPALDQFFDIDGSLSGKNDIYGRISFRTEELHRDDERKNRKILEETVLCREDIQYIFIALGDDAMNRSAAKVCAEARELGLSYSIHFVQESRRAGADVSPCAFPIYVNADIKSSPLYQEIERMAYNVHLAWRGGPAGKHSALRADFRKPYNHTSCVGNALSIKYKLHSMGIHLDENNPLEAAREFYLKTALRKTTGKKQKETPEEKRCREIRSRLIYIEHRRWVTEKLCEGWKNFDRLEDCAFISQKDDRAKLHSCIVRSECNEKLYMLTKSCGNQKWDSASDKELGELDELDRMSVELHRIYVRAADETRKKNILNGSVIRGIQEMIDGLPGVSSAFYEWYSCMKEICWNKNSQKAAIYKRLKNAFMDAVKELPKKQREAIRGQVTTFELLFFPILASMQYVDYKQKDQDLIDNIPFILTYSASLSLVIPFCTGDNTAIFGNVASASVVSPARIIYLWDMENLASLTPLKNSLKSVISYMDKKLIHSAIEFVIVHRENNAETFEQKTTAALKEICGTHLRYIRYIPVRFSSEVIGKLNEWAANRYRGRSNILFERNDSSLSAALDYTGFYDRFPGYRMDAAAMKFSASPACEYLNYIPGSPFISISDMAAFKLSSGQIGSQPEFYADYEALWQEYRTGCGTLAWKQLCSLLADYSERSDVLASFEKKDSRKKSLSASEYCYILPFSCADAVNKVLNMLLEQGIIEEGSRIRGRSSDSCEAIIYDRLGNKSEFDRLFAPIHKLMSPNSIIVLYNNRDHAVKVRFNNLVVTRAPLQVQTGNLKLPEIRRLLNFLHQKGYIINLHLTDDFASFSYATPAIKNLLTMEGRLLEVYAYHKLKETGKFDDVVSSYEIQWGDTDVRNEFDCIVTKGFQMLFIECKARGDIQQEFYQKLATLVTQFGINARAVLIADTQEREGHDRAKLNTMQRDRGDLMDIITIWKEEEITDIGRTLLNILSGRYSSES